jgi:hypothetical protein
MGPSASNKPARGASLRAVLAAVGLPLVYKLCSLPGTSGQWKQAQRHFSSQHSVNGTARQLEGKQGCMLEGDVEGGLIHGTHFFGLNIVYIFVRCKLLCTLALCGPYLILPILQSSPIVTCRYLPHCRNSALVQILARNFPLTHSVQQVKSLVLVWNLFLCYHNSFI